MTNKSLENIFMELEVEDDDNHYSNEEIIEIEKSIKLREFQKQSFLFQIDSYINGHMPSNENFYLGVVPKILNKNKVYNQKMVMSQKAFEKIIGLESGHHIPIDIIKKLPTAMGQPYLVIEGSSDNTLVEIIELKDDLNKEILVAIRIDAKEVYMDVTRVTSAYGKNRINNYLSNKNRKILDIYNEKKTNLWLVNRGLQLSKFPSTNDLSYKYIICKKDKNINDKFISTNSIENKNKTIICLVINMETKERKEKQLQLAKLFYEMGMEQDVILKISGIDMSEYLEIKEKNKDVDKSK